MCEMSVVTVNLRCVCDFIIFLYIYLPLLNFHTALFGGSFVEN